MNDPKVKIVGISDASAPFLSNPVIHTRYSEAVNFVGHERTQLSYVLVRSQPGVNAEEVCPRIAAQTGLRADRKSTRLNSSHVRISYAVLCLSKKKNVGASPS